MLESHKKFHSANGRRQILIVDDEQLNRELLGMMLQQDYEILFACDGVEAMEKIRGNRTTLSLILLDILMPNMSGMEVLSAVKTDSELSGIPIIVTTAERASEVQSLQQGAIDFIPKPYPESDVILARVQRTIELYEDRDIIQSTERDTLTGLYNPEYFSRYAEQFDQYHTDMDMDAVVLDVNHFHIINERYGRAYGDELLRKIGEQVREMVQDAGGIVCRRNADTFMIYCPHREDYREILDKVSVFLTDEDSGESRIWLRMGVYANIDKSVDMERRFDRAKMAADTVKGNYANNIGQYDNSLHERELYESQLIEDFSAAVAENQFKVYYQPKFDVRPDTPVLTSAEALVRWEHPKLGMVSPGVFIPLFENNGLIQKLDMYVWKETARQIREWKDRLHYSVPVSVNVSRIDMFDPNLPDTMQSILRGQNLTEKDLFLEVTESAYTQESQQIIETVKKLQGFGFRVEMDDFGTGYSSLNMISTLPIDVLKLDMQFIRNAFREGGNTHMLEVIIGIADYLAVPVIAEGVETEEQYRALKILGCDIVQGYFFSKPVPSEEFEPFILQKKEAEFAKAQKNQVQETEVEERLKRERLQAMLSKPGQATGSRDEFEKMPEKGVPGLAAGAAGLVREAGGSAAGAGDDRQAGSDLAGAEENGQTGSKTEKNSPEENKDRDPAAWTAAGGNASDEQIKEHTGIQLKTASVFFVIIALIAAAALLIADLAVTRGYQRMEAASDRYIAAQIAASDMESGSDYLTDRVRCFVVTGEMQYLMDFIEEVGVTKRRDNAMVNLEKLLDGKDGGALENLNTALTLSNELVKVENRAMHLMLESGQYDMSEVPQEILAVELTPEEQAMTPEEKMAEAEKLVFDNNYMHYKDRIRENVGLCTQALIRSSSQELEQSSAQLSVLVNIQTLLTIVFLLIVILIVVIITQLIRKPLTNMVRLMQDQQVVPPIGVEELRFVTRTYNKILQENSEAREKLSHEASHDALTGLFNRGAYDLLMESADTEHMALLLIDVDYFKGVNDTYGHAVGDRVLKRVAEILRHSFRSVDILCRIGGDEFAVVMTRVNSSMRQLVINKIMAANELLQHPKDDLPPVSLSVGVAFSDRENPQGDIFKDADTALYRVKESGRKGCAVYE